MNDPILPMMLLTAVAGALLVFILPRQSGRAIGWTAFFLSLVPTLLGVMLLYSFSYSHGGDWQNACNYDWMPQFGMKFSLGVDAISLWLLALTLVVTPLCILDAIDKVHQRQNEFFGWMLLLYAAMIGVFTAHNVLLFYLFFEFTLIPTFFLLGIWGHAERRRAAAKFFLYAFTGSVLLLASLIYLAYVYYQLTTIGQQPGVVSFALEDLYRAGQSLAPWQQALVFWGLLIGFAIKVPLFPVHTWMPLALTESPTPSAVMIAAFKLGAYGLIRFALPMLPAAAVRFTPWLAVICIISILFGGLVAWVQRDMKKLVAYSIVSHLGLCVLAFLALTAIGISGGILVMINQGILAAGLLLVMGMIYQRYHTRDMSEVSGLIRRLPALGFFAVYFAIGTAAVPGLNGFVSEILSLVGVYVSGQGRYGGHLGPVYAIIASLGMILGALYMIYWVAKVLFGPLVEAPELESSGAAASGSAKPADLSFREWVVLTPLAILVLVLGIFPGPVLDSMQPAINQIRMEVITATSPPPMHGSAPVAAARQAEDSDKLTALAH